MTYLLLQPSISIWLLSTIIRSLKIIDANEAKKLKSVKCGKRGLKHNLYFRRISTLDIYLMDYRKLKSISYLA